MVHSVGSAKLLVATRRLYSPASTIRFVSQFHFSFCCDDKGVARAYEVRPRKDHRDVDLISGALPFGALWYVEPNAIANAVEHAKFRSRSHHAAIRVYDEAGKLIELHRHKGDSKNYDRPYSADCRCGIGPRICRIQIPCRLSRDVHLR